MPKRKRIETLKENIHYLMPAAPAAGVIAGLKVAEVASLSSVEAGVLAGSLGLVPVVLYVEKDKVGRVLHKLKSVM